MGMGGGETGEERGMKKGPWTAAEDALLAEYVKRHGEGNWNAVTKNTGLMRCGKSCRLRWANHLRPDLKKGCLSPDEEAIILHLHSQLGNKWARMASQLPGRTDNEIKNYWNTRMKRRQRAGLPIYPREIQEELASFQCENRRNRTVIMPAPSNSTSSSSSFSSISSYQPRKRPCLDPFPTPSLNPAIPSDPSMSYQIFRTLYTASSCSSDLSNPNHLLEFMSENSSTGINKVCSSGFMSYSSLLMGEESTAGLSSFSLGLDNLELPSDQTPTTHSFTSDTLDCHDEDENVFDPMPRGNSGLLDALLEESRALSRGGVSKEIKSSSSGLHVKEKKRVDHEEEPANRMSSSDQSSTERNPSYNNKYEEPTSEKTMVDDDDDLLLMSLLNNFPSSTPLPDWYCAAGNQSDGSGFAAAGVGNLRSDGLTGS